MAHVHALDMARQQREVVTVHMFTNISYFVNCAEEGVHQRGLTGTETPIQPEYRSEKIPSYMHSSEECLSTPRRMFIQSKRSIHAV